MRVVAGVLVSADAKNSNNKDYHYFDKLGYSMTILPKVQAVYASHPMRLAYLGIQFIVASIRIYPKLYDFMTKNKEKYQKMLKGKKMVMMEFYNSHPKSLIEFYSPVQKGEAFWLTKHPAPCLNDTNAKGD